MKNLHRSGSYFHHFESEALNKTGKLMIMK